MTDDELWVRFDPSGKVARGHPGETLLGFARRAGVHVDVSCGGDGTCGRCRVRVIAGAVDGGLHARFTPDEVRRGHRLTCTARVRSDLRVEIPRASVLDHSATSGEATGPGTKILREAQVEGLVDGFRVDPAVFKAHVSLPPPSREDALPDLDRLLLALKRTHGIAPVSVSFSAVRSLGRLLRGSRWEATATLVRLRDRYRLIQVEPGDTCEENYALVVDIGTTTLAAQLLDLRETEGAGCSPVATASSYNPQLSYGEDVISRLLQALRPHGLEAQQRAVAEGINELFARLFQGSLVSRERVSHVIVAGNPTMTHIFLGLHPRGIREAPYVPTVSDVPVVRARSLGLELREHVPLWCFPLVASWVGGDVVAGVLASGLWQRGRTTLFIDMGTNGELVLGNRDWLVTTSCSAGPAFEGGGIRCGMRAARGAIENVRGDAETLEPTVTTIGGERPLGLCGSGLIAAAAELFRCSVLAPNGRFDEGARTPRLRASEYGQWELVLAWAAESDSGEDIVLTGADVQNLVRTKAAIFAGCRVLLQSVGASFADADQVVIAGGSGSAWTWNRRFGSASCPPCLVNDSSSSATGR